MNDFYTDWNNIDVDDLVKKYGTPSKLVHFKSGSILIFQDEVSEYMLLVVSGKIKAFRYTENGKERTFEVDVAPTTVGDICMFDGGPNISNAIAVTDVEAIRFTREEFFETLFNDTNFLKCVLTSRARKSRAVSRQSIDVYYSVYQRIARVFLDRYFYGDSQENKEGFAISQTELACIAATSKQRVNAAVTFFNKSGYIEYKNGICKVLDEKGLMDFYINS